MLRSQTMLRRILMWINPFYKSKQELRTSLRELAQILETTDQRWWAGVLHLRGQRVAREPKQAARETLSLFEGARAPAGTTEGGFALDTVVLTRSGSAYTADNPGLWRETLRYTRLLHKLYEDALQVWFSSSPARLNPPSDESRTSKLADYGGGSQVWWRKGGSYVVRYDCGAHVSIFREDVISEREMEQALLGPRHFTRMILSLQNRLQKAGIDPYQGSFEPLPDPD